MRLLTMEYVVRRISHRLNFWTYGLRVQCSKCNESGKLVGLKAYVNIFTAFYTVSQKKHVTTFFAITRTMNVRL